MESKQQTNSLNQQPSLFDRIDAERDNAIQQVERNADPDWKEMAYITGYSVARRNSEFLSEDVWQALLDQGVHTHEPRAMGAVMRRLHADKVIEPTDRFVKSPSPLGHGRPSRVWRSLVVAEPYRTLETHDRQPSSDSRPTPSYRSWQVHQRDYYYDRLRLKGEWP